MLTGVLVFIGLVAILFSFYYIKRAMNEHDEMIARIEDLEIASTGYYSGELNGAYSRVLKRQKRNKNER